MAILKNDLKKEEMYNRALVYIRYLFLFEKTYFKNLKINSFLVSHWNQTPEKERFYPDGEQWICSPSKEQHFIKAYSLFLWFSKRDVKGSRELIMSVISENLIDFQRFEKRRSLAHNAIGRFLPKFAK